MDIATLGLRVDSSGAVRELRTFDAALDRTAASSATAAGKIKSGLGGIAATARSLGPLLAVGLATAAFRKLIDETIEAQNAQAQLKAAIASTGGAAGLTESQLNGMADALQNTSTYSDEAVKGAQAVLLTFTQIKGAEFGNATQAVLDLSTRMGGDLKGAALQVGKALQDPVQGINALRRAGVSFTDAQKDVIANLVNTGRSAEAQRLILKELEIQFGGSAAAARNTLGGALTGLKNQFGELFEQTEANTRSTVGFINAITKALGAWQRFANRNVADFSDATSSGGIRQLATVTISAAPITAADREATAVRRVSEIKRASADRQHAADVRAAADIRLRGEEEERYLGFVTKIAAALTRVAEARKAASDTMLGLGGVRAETAGLAAGAAAQITAAGEASKKMAGALSSATAVITQAATDFVINKLGGGTLGGAVGGGVGRAVAGGFGGFGGTAVGQAIFGPIVAGFGAAVGKSIDRLFDFSGAVKAAREAMAKLRESLERSLAVERAKSGNGNVALIEAENSVREYYRNLRETTEAAFKILPVATGGTRADLELNRIRARQIADKAARMAELDALEKLALERARKYVAETQKLAREDLEVRALTAQGKNKEADALRKDLADRREILEAERAGMDAAYIARLKEIQALEKTTKTLDELTGSLRNAPAGFKVQPYQFEFGAPKTSEPKYPAGPSIPYSPERPAYPRAGTSTGTVTNSYTFSFPNTEFKIEGNTTEEIFKSFVTKLRQKKDATLGATGTLSDALDRLA